MRQTSFGFTHFVAWAACVPLDDVCSQSMYLLHHAISWLSRSEVQSLFLLVRRIRMPEAIFAIPLRSLVAHERGVGKVWSRAYRTPVYAPVEEESESACAVAIDAPAYLFVRRDPCSSGHS